MAVKVEDHRAGVAGYAVGAKYGWGHEGSTIELKGKASLADQVARDALTILRTQGYRAELLGELPGAVPDILLTIRIDTFNVLLFLGALDVRVNGLFLMDVVRSNDSRRLADAVGARFEVPSSLYPSDADFQKCFEQLYLTMRDKLSDRLRVGLSP